MSCKIGLARSTTTGFMCQNAHHRGRDSSESCHGITKMWRAKARTKLAKSISKCSPSFMARAISTTRNLWKDRYRCDGLQGQAARQTRWTPCRARKPPFQPSGTARQLASEQRCYLKPAVCWKLSPKQLPTPMRRAADIHRGITDGIQLTFSPFRCAATLNLRPAASAPTA
jgi:hypothetical protein